MEVLNMEKIIPNGMEVLIFKYVKEWGFSQNDEDYVVGVVQSSGLSDDLSPRGSGYYVQVYEVLGEDGKIYRGTYGDCLIGNSFFRTKEDHINVLKRKIACNTDKISKLQKKNEEFVEDIELLEKGMKNSENVLRKTRKLN